MFKLLKNIDYKKIEIRISEIDKELIEVDKLIEKKKKNLQLQKSDLEKINNSISLKKEKLDLLMVNLDLINEETDKIKAENVFVERELSSYSAKLDTLMIDFNSKKLNKSELVQAKSNLENHLEKNKKEIQILNKKTSDFESDIFKLKIDITELESQSESVGIELERIESIYNDKNYVYSKLNEDLNKIKSEINFKKNQIAEYSEKLLREESELFDLNKNFEILTSEDSFCEQKLQELKDEMLRIEQKKNIIDSVISDYKNELGSSKITNSSIAKALELKKSELSLKENERNELEAQLGDLKEELINKQHEEQSLNLKQTEVQQRIIKIQNSLYDVHREKNEFSERISDLEVELTTLNADLEYKENELARFQAENLSTQRSLDSKTIEFDGLKNEVSRISKEIDLCVKESDHKKTSLLKLDANILSIKEQLKVQYDSLGEYSERRRIASEELEVSQIKYNNLFDEVSKVYREWTEEKINYEDLEKRLSSINLECTTLSSRLASINEQRDDLNKDIGSIGQKISEFVIQKQNLELEIQKNESDIDYLKVTAEHTTKKFVGLSEELNELTKKNQTLESDKKILEFKSAEFLKEKNQLSSSITAREDSIKKLESSISLLNQNISSLDIDITSKKLEVERLSGLIEQAQVKNSDLAITLKKLNEENLVLNEKLDVLNSDYSRVAHLVSKSEEDIKSASHTKEKTLASIEELIKQKSEFETKVETNSLEIVNLNNEIEKISASKKELAQQLKSLVELNNILQEDYNVTYARYNDTTLARNEIVQKIAQGNHDILNIEVKNKNIEEMLATMTKDVLTLEGKLHEHNRLLQLKELEHDNLTKKLNVKEEEFQVLKSGESSLISQVDSISAQIQSKLNEEKNIEKLKLELVSSVDELERKKLTYQARLRSVSVRETELSNLHRAFSSEKTNLVNEIVKLEGSLVDSERNISILQAKNENEFRELKELRIKYSELMNHVQMKKGTFETSSTGNSAMMAERAKLRKKIAELQVIDKNIDLEFERKQKESLNIDNEILSLKQKINTLEESIDLKKTRNNNLISTIDDKLDTQVKLGAKREELNLVSKESLKTKKTTPGNLTETLINKIENYLAKVSFNTNLLVKNVADNDANRELLTMFYTNLNRVLDYFEFVEDINLELGNSFGRIIIKGSFKKELDIIRTDSTKKSILLMFRTLKEAQVGDVMFDSGKMTLNYTAFAFEKEKGF